MTTDGWPVMIDGAICARAAISVNAEAVQFGLGVFTTLAVVEGRPQWVEAHQRRLTRDAAHLGFRYVSEGLAERCARFLAALPAAVNGLKVLVLVDHGALREVLVARPHGYTEERVEAGRRLRLVSCDSRRGRRWAQHKTLNYGEHLLAQREALQHGYDDALWVDDDGALLEAATASFFLVRCGEILTPPLQQGVLAGVSRERILALNTEFPVREMPVPREWLAEVEVVFVANALGGVMPVRQIDEQQWALSPTSWALRLRRALLSRP